MVDDVDQNFLRLNEFSEVVPTAYFCTMTNEQWIAEVKRLEAFFRETPILLKDYKNGHSVITDIPKYIDAHLACAKANTGNDWFAGYIKRLQDLEQVILNQTKITQ